MKCNLLSIGKKTQPFITTKMVGYVFTEVKSQNLKVKSQKLDFIGSKF